MRSFADTKKGAEVQKTREAPTVRDYGLGLGVPQTLNPKPWIVLRGLRLRLKGLGKA